jgi:predicted 3-demethylubiquinone-9 3-methyltransferase (glyoxalase superfamily)
VDSLWDRLVADGGEPGRCGWLKDRWGLSWQIVPAMLPELIGGPDKERAGRVMQAMFKMQKIDIKTLENA